MHSNDGNILYANQRILNKPETTSSNRIVMLVARLLVWGLSLQKGNEYYFFHFCVVVHCFLAL